MAFTEFAPALVETKASAFIEARRPPVELRAQIDLAYRISGQSVEIFEIRPQFDDPSQSMEHAIAKATWVKSDERWKIYWQGVDLAWQRYDLLPEAKHLDGFLDAVTDDPAGCFWG